MSKQIIIVDIDGTVSKVGDRIKFLGTAKPDWDSFYNACFEDEPIQEIVDLIDNLKEAYTIVFCTGRRESVRAITEKWLEANGLFGKVLMRPDHDRRHDIHVKPEQIKNAGIELNQVAFVLEDRDSMVKKWRELGLKCLQVDYGDF